MAMRKYFFVFGFLALVVCGCASTPDFRGLRLPSEGHAEDLLDAGLKKETFTGSSEKISAIANAEYFLGEISGFWIQLSNQSGRPIVMDQRFADYTLLTKTGERLVLLGPTVSYYPTNEKLNPKGRMSFSIRLGRPKLRREDIRMIVCSFDLEKTKVYLFPNPEKFSR